MFSFYINDTVLIMSNTWQTITSQEKISDEEYPISINRFLSLAHICSRRTAEPFVASGKVKINGTLAQLGDRVHQGDIVTVSPAVTAIKKTYEYWLYHKPTGIVSHNPQEGETGIEDVFKKSVPLSPVGRLDKASEGLMLLTNDGRIINRVGSPDVAHEKEYLVVVDKAFKNTAKTRMEKGVNIEGYMTQPAKVKITGETSFRIILTEGKKHQIRRMCAALGYQVVKLKRVRIMNLTLGSLASGVGRKLTPKEYNELMEAIKLN